MRTFTITVLLITSLFVTVSCTAKPAQVSYEDGTYRGGFIDGNVQQVSLEFSLKNNVVTKAGFRHLEYGRINYRTSEEPVIQGLRGQYQQLLDYLIGKDIRTGLKDLYQPGSIVTENVDAFSGATLRAGKVISSIRDALNRGVYSY